MELQGGISILVKHTIFTSFMTGFPPGRAFIGTGDRWGWAMGIFPWGASIGTVFTGLAWRGTAVTFPGTWNPTFPTVAGGVETPGETPWGITIGAPGFWVTTVPFWTGAMVAAVVVVAVDEIFCPWTTLYGAPTMGMPFSTRGLVTTLFGSTGRRYSDFRFRPRFFFSTPRCFTSKYSRERLALSPFGPWRFPWSKGKKKSCSARQLGTRPRIAANARLLIKRFQLLKAHGSISGNTSRSDTLPHSHWCYDTVSHHCLIHHLN